jgi:hypothetical protein
MTRDGARTYCSERDLSIDPEAIAEALLDHKIESDRYGYADINTAAGREYWSGVATEINWQMLTTDRGAQRIPDISAYETALRRKHVVEYEIDEAAHEAERRSSAAKEKGEVTPELLLDVIALNDRRLQLQTELGKADAHIDRLRNDRQTWLIHDTAEEPAPVSFDEVELRVFGQVRPPSEPSRVLREWVSVREFALIAEVSPVTAARWAKGRHLPYHAGDPRRPWEPDAIPIDQSLGVRRRRIILSGIKPGFFQREGMQRRIAQIRSEWPQGWSERQCKAPLEMPAVPARD